VRPDFWGQGGHTIALCAQVQGCIDYLHLLLHYYPVSHLALLKAAPQVYVGQGTMTVWYVGRQPAVQPPSAS
jgi:hypothetical protein